MNEEMSLKNATEIGKAIKVLREVIKNFPNEKIWSVYDDYDESEFLEMDPDDQYEAVSAEVGFHFSALQNAVLDAFRREGIQYEEAGIFDESHTDYREYEVIKLGIARVGDYYIQAEYIWDYKKWNLYFDGITVIEDYTGEEWYIES